MSTHSKKNSISKLLSVAGFASASLLLSIPAFALIPTSPTESHSKTQELLAQRSSDSSPKPEGDQVVPTAPSPSDPSVDEVTPAEPTTQSQQRGMDSNQSPRPEGDQVVPTAPSPSDPSVDEVTPAEPSMQMENNQMQMEGSQRQRNESPSAQESNDNDMNRQYSGSSDRLRPGSWLCINNPNPQCDS